MTKVAVEFRLPWLKLDERDPAPLSRQLYKGIRQAVLGGRLRPGNRLPSTRAFATEFGISRNTITNAYEQLLSEGYLDARVGAGTCVAQSLPEGLLDKSVEACREPRRSERQLLSKRGKSIVGWQVRPLRAPHQPKPFEAGLPDPQIFPYAIWRRLISHHWRRPHYELLGYGDPAGYRPLRAAIASYLRSARAVRCETDQVFIVNGSQQALNLCAQLLVDPGDPALIENPGYSGARFALEAAGARLIPLPVDESGVRLPGICEAERSARLIFVTPSHQFPLGVTLSLARRLELVEWARRRCAWILEDDYDSEYRYQGKPLPSLQGLDQSGRVIYMGSFSKTLFPSLRLGFMVLPNDLVEPFRRARSVLDVHSPLFEQAVLADFVSEGHFARHVRRMRSLYGGRQTTGML
jgi:GntR family transcriptional regulator/MocR family aminotransferase